MQKFNYINKSLKLKIKYRSTELYILVKLRFNLLHKRPFLMRDNLWLDYWIYDTIVYILLINNL